MYSQFYGLSGSPFQLTPDPGFFFPSAAHRRALSYIGFGLAQGEGFIVITGEGGVGKSTLFAHLMANVNPEDMTVGYVAARKDRGQDFLHHLARGFGIENPGQDKASAQRAVELLLENEVRANRRCLLAVDDAHLLPTAALEELSMLAGQASLQVLLLGRPELATALQCEPMLALVRQRVLAAHHLAPMHASDMWSYLEHRLTRVGWTGTPSFDQRVIRAIQAASCGVPRRINRIADRLLLLGAVEQRKHIDFAMYRLVLDDLAGDNAFPAAVPMQNSAKSPPGGRTGGQSVMDDEAHAVGTPLPAASHVMALLAERDRQIAELQHAVSELVNEREDRTARMPGDDMGTMTGKIAELEARLVEQEQAMRHTLTMLIETIEGDLGHSAAA